MSVAPFQQLAAGWSQQSLSSRTKLLLGVGFCGSFTTFSTYAVDVVSLALTHGQYTRAASYIVLNNAGSLAAAVSGMKLTKRILML
jgi:fluoride exporter